MRRRPLFIVFEGIDGAGTTTQCTMLCEELERQGRPVVRTREPGGTPTGERIRDLLLDPANTALDHLTELLLYEASRRQHVIERIGPSLDSGIPVISDRYAASTVAYQGGGRGLDGQLIAHLNHVATDGLDPDLTIFLDLPVEVAEERRSRRGGGAGDRLEQEGRRLQESVRTAYLVMARDDPERSVIVDARPPVDAVAAEVRGVLSSRFPAFPFTS